MDDYEAQGHYENMMNFFDKWEKERAEGNRRASEFIEHLSEEIIKLSIRYFPEVEEHKQKFITPLKERMEKLAEEIIETIDPMLYPGKEQEYQYPKLQVPERDQSETERIYRENIFKTMPLKQQASFILLDDVRVKNEAFEREFLFQWHDKIKELLNLHFPEIVEFSSNQLRYLNYSAYSNASEFVSEFYYYAGDYIIDRFPWPED
jgi:hypothetical protein